MSLTKFVLVAGILGPLRRSNIILISCANLIIISLFYIKYYIFRHKLLSIHKRYILINIEVKNNYKTYHTMLYEHLIIIIIILFFIINGR